MINSMLTNHRKHVNIERIKITMRANQRSKQRDVSSSSVVHTIHLDQHLRLDTTTCLMFILRTSPRTY